MRKSPAKSPLSQLIPWPLRAASSRLHPSSPPHHLRPPLHWSPSAPLHPKQPASEPPPKGFRVRGDLQALQAINPCRNKRRNHKLISSQNSSTPRRPCVARHSRQLLQVRDHLNCVIAWNVQLQMRFHACQPHVKPFQLVLKLLKLVARRER